MTHKTVASLLSTALEPLLASLAALPASVDLAEIRLDALWPKTPEPELATDQLLALVDGAHHPLIATLRPIREGGRFEGPEEVRLGLLAAAGRAGFAHLDIERDAAAVPGVLSAMRESGAQPFASRHYSGPTPCKDDCLVPLAAMQDAGGLMDKFAFDTGAYPELLRALEVAVLHAKRGGKPCVSPMGYGGAPIRALLGVVANHATYGHAPGLPPAVSGQPAIADVEQTWASWGLERDERCSGLPRPWIGVLGMPANHSQSPRIHNAWLRQAARPERVAVLEVPASAGALKLTLHVAPRLGMVGAAIMSPHKADAARFSQCDAAATAVGAANCLRFDGEAVHATNTDLGAIQTLLGARARDATAVVLGSGAAARGAIVALQQAGVSTVQFSSRDPSKARAVRTDLGASWIAWERRNEAMADIWINATPLGARPADASPLLASRIRSTSTVLEMNYAAGTTALEELAQQRRAHIIPGLVLLEQQARQAYQFWTGTPAPAASSSSPATSSPSSATSPSPFSSPSSTPSRPSPPQPGEAAIAR